MRIIMDIQKGEVSLKAGAYHVTYEDDEIPEDIVEAIEYIRDNHIVHDLLGDLANEIL